MKVIRGCLILLIVCAAMWYGLWLLANWAWEVIQREIVIEAATQIARDAS